MPQLNPAPWFTTLVAAWILLLILIWAVSSLQPAPHAPHAPGACPNHPWTWTWH